MRAEGSQPPANALVAPVGLAAARAMPSSAKRAVATKSTIGFFATLIMVWIAFEYGRPPNPMSIPLVISVLLFGGWLLRRPKRWGTQLTAFVLLLVVMAIDIPLAVNTYSAVWTRRRSSSVTGAGSEIVTASFCASISARTRSNLRIGIT